MSQMRKKGSNAQERRKRILTFFKEAGAWKISASVVKQLAKDFDVTERQIYRDIRTVIKNIPKPAVSEVANKFLISWDYAIDKAIQIMRNADPDIAAKGIKLYFETVEKYTEFLHQYGFKNPDPEKEDPTKYIFNIVETVKSREEIRDEKRKMIERMQNASK